MACSMYLEALRKPNLVTAVSMSAVVLNVVIGLILVPQYGAVGRGVGDDGLALVHDDRLPDPDRLHDAGLRGRRKGPAGEFTRQNKVGIGTGIANAAEWGAFNMTFVIATLVSIDAGTIYGLAVQMMGVIFMIYVGLGTATSVRVAERYGRGKGRRARGVAAWYRGVGGAGTRAGGSAGAVA